MNTYKLPPEWHPQAAILLTWPDLAIPWQVPLSDVEAIFTQLIDQISQYQQVIILCDHDKQRDHVFNQLQSTNTNFNHIHCYCIPNNDIWIRDYGPITLINQHQGKCLDFTFNGWGEKFNATSDNALNQQLIQTPNFQAYDLETHPFVLEGGSIETDGHGLLLTTANCLLNKNRNPHLNQPQIESYLKQALNIEKIVFLQSGCLIGDDTDGHIDTLARFCNETTLCYVSCNNKHDPHYEPLQKMQDELKYVTNTNGKSYQLISLPLPKPIFDQNAQRLPATYANFIITNNAILVPVYDDPSDHIACNQLSDCFTDKTIIPIPGYALITQSGSLHCASMQLPLITGE